MQLSDDALARHVYVLGGTGVGKSRALESWLVQLIKANQGVGVIDPHGELYDNLLARIAKQGRRFFDKVVLFDPIDPDYTVGFNPLELRLGEFPERRAQFLATVITKIFQADPAITVRMQRVMFHTFWLLIQSELTLTEFAPLLTDKQYRAKLLTPSTLDPKLRQFWEREFPSQDKTITDWIGSSLNKVDPLVTDPDFALILGQKKSTLDFRTLMDQGNILLVKLSKGVIGEAKTHLMGAFILAQIQLAALARANTQRSSLRRFHLFLDEFQNYTTDDIHQILAESRKYGLSLIMAHQFYDQLRDNPTLQAAVLSTVGNLICFQVGYQDAQRLVYDLFTPDIDEIKDVRTRKMPTGIRWWPYTTEQDIVWRPLSEIWELEARKLTELPPRFFWYKRRGGTEAELFRSLDMPDLIITPDLKKAIDTLRERSASHHGQPKDEIRNQLKVQTLPIPSFVEHDP